jgi:hypothetical protein
MRAFDDLVGGLLAGRGHGAMVAGPPWQPSRARRRLRRVGGRGASATASPAMACWAGQPGRASGAPDRRAGRRRHRRGCRGRRRPAGCQDSGGGRRRPGRRVGRRRTVSRKKWGPADASRILPGGLLHPCLVAAIDEGRRITRLLFTLIRLPATASVCSWWDSRPRTGEPVLPHGGHRATGARFQLIIQRR